MAAQFRVFYSYSHADTRMLERLRTHMAMLRRDGLITEWYDHDIEAGSEWRDEIDRELEAADVILLLVSADFLASDFCYEEEMLRAVERAQRGEALVIGVMLRPVDGWDTTPFAGFQVVPRHARPISKWSNADEAYRDVVEKIRAALEERASMTQQRPPKPVRAERAGPRAGPDKSTPIAQPASAGMPDVASPTTAELSPAEEALLAQMKDPKQRELQRVQMQMQKQSMLGTTLANLEQMRKEMLRAVAQNFRGDNPKSDKPEPDS